MLSLHSNEPGVTEKAKKNSIIFHPGAQLTPNRKFTRWILYTSKNTHLADLREKKKRSRDSMYQNHFYFDEIEQTGDKIRIINKMKAKNVMALAVNFLDEKTLAKVQNIFTNLSPDELNNFRNYLDDRKYLKNDLSSKEYKIISQISRIALSSEPEDEYLKKIYTEYKKNLDRIDELKIQTTDTIDGMKVNKLIEQIDQYNDRNLELIEKVSQYKATKFAPSTN
jgi:hypothetical protein